MTPAIAVRGNTPHTSLITNRLADAGYLITADPADAEVLITTDGAPAMLPAPGSWWIDMSTGAADDAHAARLAAEHGITRAAAPLTEIRGILYAVVRADLDPHTCLTVDPILTAAVHLVLRGRGHGIASLDLDGQFDEASLTYPDITAA